MKKINQLNIAIIGTSCRFPASNNMEEFWSMLKEAKDAITRFSKEVLLKNGYVSEDILKRKNYVPNRGILSNVFDFDAAFFHYSPYEAKIIDPQHRLFIKLCWEALEDSGNMKDLSARRVGVFAGVSDNTYLQQYLLKNLDFKQNQNEHQTTLGNSAAFLSSRVSYLLNLSGPSLVINTACSTGLVCVIEAAKALATHTCDIALAGAVSIHLPQETGYLYKEGSIASPDGKCRPFDESAKGIVRSNGAGVIVMKRLEDAIQDHDHIEAIIKGVAINNDGADKIGYTAPSVKAQASCIQNALLSANVTADMISYVETHGTGTVLGDPIEIKALDCAFKKFTQKKRSCPIGSVKSNIGHTDVAAGMAGLLKVILSMKHGLIPKSLNYTQPNKEINFDKTAFFVNQALTPWKSSTKIAAVNSLGMGGTNAHLIIQEAPAQQSSHTHRPAHPLLISAKSPHALKMYIQKFIHYFDTHVFSSKDSLANIAYTLETGRRHYDYRCFILATDAQDAVNKLESRLHTKISSIRDAHKNNTTVFMFTGQGAEYVNMGKYLYEQEDVFKKNIDLCHNILAHKFSFDLKSSLFSNQTNLSAFESVIHQTNIAQILVVVVEYALAQLLMSYGIKPSLVLGHSLGEYTAACVSGVFTLDTVLTIVFERAKLIFKSQEGMMLAINLPEHKLNEILPKSMSIASINTQELCVISGKREDLKRFMIYLQKNFPDIAIKPLPVSHALHSHMMNPMQELFYNILDKVHFNIPNIPFLSTSLVKLATPENICNANYWLNHLLNPVRFYDAIIEAKKLNHHTFIEVGPGNALSSFVQGILREDENLIVTQTLPMSNLITTNEQPLENTFYKSLGILWLNGIHIDWKFYYHQETRYRVSLPTYPFEEKTHVILPEDNATFDSQSTASSQSVNLYTTTFRSESTLLKNFSEKAIVQAKKTWVIFLDAFGLGEKVVKSLKNTNNHVIQVRHGNAFKQITENEYVIQRESKEDYQKLAEVISRSKVDYIFHLDSISNAPERDSNDRNQFQKLLTRYFSSLCHLSDAFFVKDCFRKTKLIIASNYVFKIFTKDHYILVKSVLPSVTKVIAQEYAIESCRFIDIGENNDCCIKDMLHEFYRSMQTQQLVAYRKKERWIKTIKEIGLKTRAEEKFKWKQNGIYCITGGLGTLGLIFAQYIAEQARQSTIILLNRTAFIPRDQWRGYLKEMHQDKRTDQINTMMSIEKSGASVINMICDISDFEQLQKTINFIQSEYGTINGVIHAAGLTGHLALKDLATTTAQFLQEQFSGKIIGACNLIQLLNWNTIDFLIVFSSLSTLTGGIGYASYSAANSCLDALASIYSNKKIWSIAWDTWKKSIVKTKPRHSLSIPYYALSTTEAISAFKQWLTMKDYPHVFIAKGNLINRLNAGYQTMHIAQKKGRDTCVEHKVTIKTDSFNSFKTQIANALKYCLKLDNVLDDDDFYDLGGNSLLLVRFSNILQKQTGIKLTPMELNQYRSINSIVNYLTSKEPTDNPSPLVEIQPLGDKPPLFLFHPVEGTISCYFDLVRLLGSDIKIIGIQDPLSLKQQKTYYPTFEHMASYYIQYIRRDYPKGPYSLAGLSFGGNLAFEVALQLQDLKQSVTFIGLFDSWALFSDDLKDRKQFNERMKESFNELKEYIGEGVMLNSFIERCWYRMELLLRYHPRFLENKVTLFKASKLLKEYQAIDNPFNYWKKHARQLELRYITGTHNSILTHPSSLKEFSKNLKNILKDR
jgi:acyl transferase domain-containing protein/thioesterase domain-containing protein/acyl carrier protein